MFKRHLNKFTMELEFSKIELFIHSKVLSNKKPFDAISMNFSIIQHERFKINFGRLLKEHQIRMRSLNICKKIGGSYFANLK